MAGKSSQGNNRGSDLFGYFVSGKHLDYHTAKSGYYNNADAPGIQATGGVISDYTTPPGDVYRTHIFTSSGTFDVQHTTSNPNLPNGIEYLVVAGGGGGGGDGQSGGGGAGGFRTNLVGHPVKAADYEVTSGTYTVTVGGGGAGGYVTQPKRGFQGGHSEFYPPAVGYPNVSFVRSVGGGGGNGYGGNPTASGQGGSGGGARNSGDTTGAAGNTPLDPNHPQVQGYKGGDSPTYAEPYSGGGGGGAGGEGAPDNPSDAPYPGAGGVNQGGYGLQALIAGPPADPQPMGTPGPGSGAAGTGYFAGGGGGGGYDGYPADAAGGYGGGGAGGANPAGDGVPGTFATGGGGGGSRGPSPTSSASDVGGNGGAGGSGIVVVRYKIGSITATQKATGGSISYYGGKTIHTFTSTGTFNVPAAFNETVEYVIVGGGGAGGGPSIDGGNSYYGGGGGAGAFIKGSTPISAPTIINVQIGAGGSKNMLTPASGSPSYFGTPRTAAGGGYGASYRDSGGGPFANGGPGGSSGGSYGGTVTPATGSTFSPKDASADSPTSGWGHQGGTASGNPNGGGGGAGSVGENADSTNGGDGGQGMQLPATFRNPASTIGAPGPTSTSSHNPGWTGIDDSGKFWVAGGGGGSGYGPENTHTSGVGGIGTPSGGSGPYAGAGSGSKLVGEGGAAIQNTGSGGGGMERGPSASIAVNAGNGGSGLVLIAYPS